MKTCTLAGMLALLPLIVSCDDVPVDDIPSNATSAALDELLAEVRELVQASKFDDAAALLQSADVDALAQAEIDRIRAIDSTEPVIPTFMAFAEEAIIVPGIPNRLDNVVWDERRFREVPGSSDTSESWQGEYQRSGQNLCLKYNSRVLLLWATLQSDDQYVLSEDLVRRRLYIDEATWGKTPAEARALLVAMETDGHHRVLDSE